MKTKVIAFVAGLLATVSLGVLAQISGGGVEGGGGRPAGSAFAVQYKSGTSFGGTGPGTAGQVLTSNGAGAAPTFQTGGGGGVTQTTGTGTLNYTTACTVAQTQNFAYVQTGMVVTLTFTSEFACTSNSTTMVSDALPAAIRPARKTSFGNLMAQNNSAVVPACFQIDTTGVLTWWPHTSGQCAASTAWTASGTKGPLTLIGTSPFIATDNNFTYTLN